MHHHIQIQSLFLNLAIVHPIWAYGIIFLLFIIEGSEITLFPAAFLAQSELLELKILLPLALIGVFLGDYLWYSLGKILVRKSKYVRHWVDHMAQPFDTLIKKRPQLAILVTKFLWAVNRPALIRTGMLGTRFKSFFEADIIAALFWVIGIGGIAYKLSESIIHLRHYVTYAEVGLLIIILGFIFGDRLLTLIIENVLEVKSERNVEMK